MTRSSCAICLLHWTVAVSAARVRVASLLPPETGFDALAPVAAARLIEGALAQESALLSEDKPISESLAAAPAALAEGDTASALEAADPESEEMWAARAHRLRMGINTVAFLIWLVCLGAAIMPPKKSKAADIGEIEREETSNVACGSIVRIVGGISLAILSFVYVFSYGTARHMVMEQNVVKGALKPLFREHDEWVLSKISAELPATGRVLNFGAGGNTLSDLLVERGLEVTPLDIVDESIGNVPVVVYDGKTIPAEIGHFDAAIISTVLHHIEDRFIPNIMESLAAIAKKIIVLEDVCTPDTFNSRALNCVMMNMLLFEHPLNFRSHEAWKRRFAKYNVVNETTDGFCSTFVLEPSL